jgi:hypothetical protein
MSTSFRSACIQSTRAVELSRPRDRPRCAEVCDLTPAIQHRRSRKERAGALSIRARSDVAAEITKGLLDDAHREMAASSVNCAGCRVALHVVHGCSWSSSKICGIGDSVHEPRVAALDCDLQFRQHDPEAGDLPQDGCSTTARTRRCRRALPAPVPGRPVHSAFRARGIDDRPCLGRRQGHDLHFVDQLTDAAGRLPAFP